MIGCLRTRVCKLSIIALYFEFENELKFYNLEARDLIYECSFHGYLLISGFELLVKPAGKLDIKRQGPCDSTHLLTNWFLLLWVYTYFVFKGMLQ